MACGCGVRHRRASILWSVSEPSDLFSDFYKAYFPAADRLWTKARSRPGKPRVRGRRLRQSPDPGLAVRPLALLGEPAAGWAFLALGIAAIAATYVLLLRLGDFNVASSAMLALSILASGPLVNSLREGNTTHFILLLLVVALLLWRAGEEYAAGLVLGLCALFKLPLMLFGLYVLLRGRWRVVAGGATRDRRRRVCFRWRCSASRSTSAGTGTASSRSSAA